GCARRPAGGRIDLIERLNETVKQEHAPALARPGAAPARRRHRAPHPRRGPRRVSAPRHGRRPHAGDRVGGARQPGAAALLLPHEGAARARRVRARRLAADAGGHPGDRGRGAARRESQACRCARARPPVARAVPARIHHRRARPSSRARLAADCRGDARPDARSAAAADVRRPAAADRRTRRRGHHAADRARIVRRQPDGAVHLPLRGAPDGAGAARARRGGVFAVHRPATRRAGRFLSRSAAAMTSSRFLVRVAGAVWIAVAAMVDARAQAPLQLGSLQRAALASDARSREIEQLQRQSALRLKNLDVEQLPSVSVLGQTQYQSDVPTAPFSLPNGEPAFAPPKFTYDASLRVDQRLYDPSLEPRRALERAGLAESQARVRTSLYALRQEVNEAFFTAKLLEEQLGSLETSIADLEARLRETTARVREGAALAGDAAAVEATLLRQRQQADEIRASRRAAMARLARLAGEPIDADAPLALPDLAATASQARRDLDALRARPEYDQFARTRDRAARQEDVAAAAERPQVSAFGRVGYGRPGLNFINDGSESYAIAGLQLNWKAWNWGAAARERDALAIQQEIVSAEEASFS